MAPNHQTPEPMADCTNRRLVAFAAAAAANGGISQAQQANLRPQRRFRAGAVVGRITTFACKLFKVDLKGFFDV